MQLTFDATGVCSPDRPSDLPRLGDVVVVDTVNFISAEQP